MSKTDVAERYAQIIAETSKQVGSKVPAPALERRGAPRVLVTCQVSVNATFPVTTVDVSTTGACFLSEHAFPPGSRISINVAGVFALDATVVACVMEETDAMFLETRYRVHCHFDDESEGMEMLVVAKEHEVTD
jgi:hypothetical protein